MINFLNNLIFWLTAILHLVSKPKLRYYVFIINESFWLDSLFLFVTENPKLKYCIFILFIIIYFLYWINYSLFGTKNLGTVSLPMLRRINFFLKFQISNFVPKSKESQEIYLHPDLCFITRKSNLLSWLHHLPYPSSLLFSSSSS